MLRSENVGTLQHPIVAYRYQTSPRLRKFVLFSKLMDYIAGGPTMKLFYMILNQQTSPPCSRTRNEVEAHLGGLSYVLTHLCDFVEVYASF